jgi:hypothetical protein
LSFPRQAQKHYLNIYFDWDPNQANTLEVVAQSCQQTLPLPYTPFLLRHVKAVFPPSPSSTDPSRRLRDEDGWVVSGSDAKVHLYLEDRARGTYYEAPVAKFFPELDSCPSVVLTASVLYPGDGGSLSERVTAFGCECGYIGVALVDTWQTQVRA